jgi:hypothetical protein
VSWYPRLKGSSLALREEPLGRELFRVAIRSSGDRRLRWVRAEELSSVCSTLRVFAGVVFWGLSTSRADLGEGGRVGSVLRGSG